MSTFETAYKSLLQGVSQQLPQERLPGQLTSQTNMMSDPVTNLRRRPGVNRRAGFTWANATDSRTLAWFTDVAGARMHIMLNTIDGNIRMFDEGFVQRASLAGGAYLTTTDTSKIRAVSVGNEFYFANVGEKPILNYNGTSVNPEGKGFFYVVSGAFSKEYHISLIRSTGTYTASYTTPPGTGTGDAALSTPEYIATQLVTQLQTQSGLSIYRDGPYVYINALASSATLAVNTSVGSAYIIASKGGFVTQSGDLPARLPSQADGYICRVGTGETPQYYKYQHSTTEWLETASYDSPTSISNMPVNIGWDGTNWFLDSTPFEGRFAGDEKSNELHSFMLGGISGIGTYQGRLVVLAGPMVSLSASNRPRRFFRSTVTGVVNSDPIEIGSAMNSSAAYEWAISFQKDLLLFSRAYQAVLPSGNAAITPSTATVVPTSTHEVDTSSSPITLGRTLMYCTPRSEDFFGVLEMIPSTYTDSQYVSQDSTPHLPKYMGGRCRFAVSSGVANMALFAPTGDVRTLIVHEYHWDGEQKVQQAWHQWTFKYPVASAYFASDMIVILFIQNGQVFVGTIDPRAGAVNAVGARRPYTDMYFPATIVNHVITLPTWVAAFDLELPKELVATVSTGSLSGELVGSTYMPNGTLQTVRSYPSGDVQLGTAFYSGCVLTPPVITDYNEQVVHSGKATVLRFMVGTQNTSPYMVRVTDRYSDMDDVTIGTLTWSSPEFQLGRALYSNEVIRDIPARTDMRTSMVELWTQETGELNITSVEYVGKYNPKIKRR